MKMFIITLFIISYSFSSYGFATKEVKTQTFSVNIPSDWRDAENLFGLPHVFLGPKKLAKRATMSVVPAQNDEINLSGNLSSTAIEVYHLKRKVWVEDHQGSVQRFFPYEKKKNSALGDVHQFGFEYKIGNDSFIEHSRYFYCGKSLLNAKTLALVEDKDGNNKLESIFNSLRCKL